MPGRRAYPREGGYAVEVTVLAHLVVAAALAVPASPPLMQPADVDRLMAAMWGSAGVTPAPPADDAEFLRRVTLDVVGRVPVLDEVESFLADARPDKRVALVDRLLDSPERAEAWADVYLDLFVGRQFRKRGVAKRLDPRAYFVDAFRENRPFDRMAVEMLTFEGELAPSGPGVFLASHLKGGGPEAAAAVTARLFLGLQLQCAQCHDHPYDARYKQDDFYGLVAYFAGTKSRERRLPGAEKPERMYTLLDRRRGQRATFRRPGSTEDVAVAARFLGRATPAGPDESPRGTLARAIVASPLFAKTMVDRTWAQLFGAGIIHPWDDLGGEEDPRHPALLNRLAQDFRASGFDVRHLLRTLLLTRAYGLTSKAAPSSPQEPVRSFARAAIRRQSPDQIFRSLLVATGVDRMERPGAQPIERKIERLLREYLFVFGDDERAEIDTFDGNIPQALLLWNGEIVNRGARARRGGVLGRILAESDAPDVRLRRMFLAAVARPPTAAEQARLLPALVSADGGRAAAAAYEDLFFALLTSTEMLTNH
jgi:hypothetical protein